MASSRCLHLITTLLFIGTYGPIRDSFQVHAHDELGRVTRNTGAGGSWSHELSRKANSRIMKAKKAKQTLISKAAKGSKKKATTKSLNHYGTRKFNTSKAAKAPEVPMVNTKNSEKNVRPPLKTHSKKKSPDVISSDEPFMPTAVKAPRMVPQAPQIPYPYISSETNNVRKEAVPAAMEAPKTPQDTEGKSSKQVPTVAKSSKAKSSKALWSIQSITPKAVIARKALLDSMITSTKRVTKSIKSLKSTMPIAAKAPKKSKSSKQDPKAVKSSKAKSSKAIWSNKSTMPKGMKSPKNPLDTKAKSPKEVPKASKSLKTNKSKAGLPIKSAMPTSAKAPKTPLDIEVKSPKQVPKSVKSSKAKSSKATWSIKSTMPKGMKSPKTPLDAKAKSPKQVPKSVKSPKISPSTKSTMPTAVKAPEIPLEPQPKSPKQVPKAVSSIKAKGPNASLSTKSTMPKGTKAPKIPLDTVAKSSKKDSKAPKSVSLKEKSPKAELSTKSIMPKAPKIPLEPESPSPKEATNVPKMAISPKPTSPPATKAPKTPLDTKSPKQPPQAPAPVKSFKPKSPKAAWSKKSKMPKTKAPSSFELKSKTKVKSPKASSAENTVSPSVIKPTIPLGLQTDNPTVTLYVDHVDPDPTTSLVIQCTTDEDEQQSLENIAETVIEFTYNLQTSSAATGNGDSDMLNEILDSFEAAVIVNLSETSGCVLDQSSTQEQTSQLSSISIVNARDVADTSCTTVSSQRKCEVTASNSLLISTVGDASKSEICSLINDLKSFFDAVNTSETVNNVDAAEFKGSAYDCTEPTDQEGSTPIISNAERDNTSYVGNEEITQGSKSIAWYFVGGVVCILFIIVFVNQSYLRARGATILSDRSVHLEDPDDLEIEDVVNPAHSISSVNSKSLVSGEFDLNLGLLSQTAVLNPVDDADDCDDDVDLDSKVSNVSKSLLSGSLDADKYVLINAEDVDCNSSNVSDLGNESSL